MAALLGVVLVIIAHRGHSFAAAMLVFFGMFLSTVGMEAIRYSMRFTFSQSWLMSGLDLIVVLLGLFALSQAFLLLVQPNEKPQAPELKGRIFGGFTEILRHKRVASASAGFGVIMGIIPGVGEFLAQFFSYTLAQRISKKPERFGRGAPEGLIASETANNAVPAAAMVPLLALGIPGEALTAMMLSVFYVHGIIPGPKLFENNLYSLRNSIVDWVICAVFGLLGYILKRLQLSIVPIVLGMVLGNIMEQKFRASLARV